MKFDKPVILLLALFSVLLVNAQQTMILKPLETDSASIVLERQIEYRQLISGISPEGFLNEMPEFPKFDFNSEIDQRYTFGLTHGINSGLPNYSYFSASTTSPYFSPFYGNGMILSEGAYQLGSKLVLGGYSYGANSPFFAPMPNSSNKFDRYGSTLYMQYKVGKNFKIETRVNVSQGGIHPGF